jgi:Leucine-rich repeat (LRR) protein
MKALILLLTILLVPFLLRAQIVHIPDANFKAALVGNSGINTNGDDEIQVSEAEAYNGTIYVPNQGIADMTGLEEFTLLQYLYCYSNQLISLDVSANTALTSLSCYSNQLTGLDVSANTKLNNLSCGDNQLTNLDLSANTALTSLSCYSNQLTGLDVSANTALTSLSCYSNQLTGLDVSANTALTSLSCYSNQLTGLDVSANTALTYLYCRSNQLTNLDLSANTALTYLDCEYNQLTSPDVSENALLEQLDCERNQLTSLDVSANALLEQLICDNNQLTSLDLVGNKILELLYCGSNQLTSLDVSANVTLELLYCYSNQLTSLDISTNTALTELSCGENQLTSLDVSANTELTTFRCYSNQLTSLNIRNGNNHLITRFDATGNQSLVCIAVSDVAFANANWTNIDQGVIFSEGGCNVYIPDANFKEALLANAVINTNNDSEIQYGEAEAYTGAIEVANLGISDMTGLEAFKSGTGLDCSANNLSQLIVRRNASLVSIDCGNNELGSLDVSLNPALETLNCASNQLKGLELSNTNNLRQLDCQSNQLEILDLSVNVNLTELYCQSNQLRSLDVKNGNNEQITAFDARNNPSLSCIAVDDAAYSAANWPNVDVQGLFNEEGCAVVYIPDPNFKAALIANAEININGDSEIQVSEAKTYSKAIGVSSLGIFDLTGLEAFSKLTTLDCSFNLLTAINVESNVLIQQLYCEGNQLSTLSLTKNIKLQHLSCHSNDLRWLDLRRNVELREIYCQENQLNSLDLRNGQNHLITGFNATENPPLRCITVDDEEFANNNWRDMIDDDVTFSRDQCNVYIPDPNFKSALISDATINTNADLEIQYHEASEYSGELEIRQLGIVDLTGLQAFSRINGLFCEGNQIRNLDVSANQELRELHCGGNRLSGLDVSFNPLLEQLSAYNNYLRVLLKTGFSILDISGAIFFDHSGCIQV